MLQGSKVFFFCVSCLSSMYLEMGSNRSALVCIVGLSGVDIEVFVSRLQPVAMRRSCVLNCFQLVDAGVCIFQNGAGNSFKC